ncbi:MAG: hypothetical protein EXR71_10985 [Myxococcales bacterium]|nr:hypothetical protein [Myxococcales bacterium]
MLTVLMLCNSSSNMAFTEKHRRPSPSDTPVTYFGLDHSLAWFIDAHDFTSPMRSSLHWPRAIAGRGPRAWGWS